jgi:hypothetical protein
MLGLAPLGRSVLVYQNLLGTVEFRKGDAPYFAVSGRWRSAPRCADDCASQLREQLARRDRFSGHPNQFIGSDRFRMAGHPNPG